MTISLLTFFLVWLGTLTVGMWIGFFMGGAAKVAKESDDMAQQVFDSAELRIKTHDAPE